jgi:hypothetical protein
MDRPVMMNNMLKPVIKVKKKINSNVLFKNIYRYTFIKDDFFSNVSDLLKNVDWI